MIAYSLDEKFAYKNTQPISLPFRSVVVEPPETREGFVPLWRTDLDPVASVDFGQPGTGEWELVEDNRDKIIYSTETGDLITGFSGLGPVPENSTTEPKPSSEHIWKDGSWWLDPEIEKAQELESKKAAAQIQFDTELAKANAAIQNLQDKIDIGRASDEDQKKMLAWKSYRFDLNDLNINDPDNIKWPVAPAV